MFCIVTDAVWTLWYLVSVPIVNLLVLSPGKPFWVIPVRMGFSHDILPPAPSPSQAAASDQGGHTVDVAGKGVTAY